MDSTTIIYILTTITAIVIPLFGVLAKDGSKLYKDVKIALEDGKITDAEIDLILADVGLIFRSIVKLFSVFKR